MAPAKKNRKGSKSNSNSSSNKPKQPRKLSADELLQAAERALATARDPRHAVALCTAALRKAASWQQQAEVLERRAEVHVGLEHLDEALRDYRAALALVPPDLTTPPAAPPPAAAAASSPTRIDEQSVDILERKAALCMYIGQLSTATDALTSYLAGIEHLQSLLGLLEEEEEGAQPNNTALQQETKRQLATACCAVAELYLTDLCLDEDAESCCESFLKQALDLDDQCPDTLQAVGNLRLSQGRGAEAAPLMLRVFGGMRVGCHALASLVGLRDDDGGDGAAARATELLELEHVQDLPGYEFRCQTAKLLLECAGALVESKEQQAQLAQAAIDVLGSLLAENDEVVEVWILVGDAFAVGEANDEQKELSCHYWERALEMLTVVQKSLIEEQQEADDMEEEDAIQEQLDSVVCQMEELRMKLEETKGDDSMEE